MDFQQFAQTGQGLALLSLTLAVLVGLVYFTGRFVWFNSLRMFKDIRFMFGLICEGFRILSENRRNRHEK